MLRHSAFRLAIIASLLALSGCQPYDSLAPQRDRPCVGYLEHRGTQYPVRDLLDAGYRARSDDPFVRNFDPQTCFADRPPPPFLGGAEPARLAPRLGPGAR